MSAFQKLMTVSNEDLANLIKIHNSKRSVLRALGINPSHGKCMRYLINFVKENDIDISHHGQTKGLHNIYTKEQIEEFVKASLCWTDLIKKLGRRFYGNMISPVKRLVKVYNVDVSHFDYKKAMVLNRTAGVGNKNLDSEVFVVNSTLHRASVKRRIIKDSLLAYKCRDCNNEGTWNGKPLILELEHINGVNNDNRLENMCFLCSNCHSQTVTYSNKKR